MITQKYLREIFNFNGVDFISKVDNGRRRKGDIIKFHPAGRDKEYLMTRVKYTKYYKHRLIWIYHNGDIPSSQEIDHIDRDKTNNKLSNLRLVTRSQNNMNKKVKGYYIDKQGKFVARVKVNGKAYRKRCDTVEEALVARKELEREHFSL